MTFRTPNERAQGTQPANGASATDRGRQGAGPEPQRDQTQRHPKDTQQQCSTTSANRRGPESAGRNREPSGGLDRRDDQPHREEMPDEELIDATTGEDSREAGGNAIGRAPERGKPASSESSKSSKSSKSSTEDDDCGCGGSDETR